MKIFLPFIVVGICAGMYSMYISPLMAEITMLNERKTEYVNILEKTKELVTKRDAAIATYSSIPESDLNKLDKIIPAKFDSVIFLNDISFIAARFQLKIEGFTSNEPPSSEENLESSAKLYKSNNIIIRLSGSYPQFVNFLREIESSLQLVDVVNLSIVTSNGKTASEVTYEYTVNLNTYSLK